MQPIWSAPDFRVAKKAETKHIETILQKAHSLRPLFKKSYLLVDQYGLVEGILYDSWENSEVTKTHRS